MNVEKKLDSWVLKKKMSKVLDYLFLGGESEISKQFFEQHEIKAVVNCTKYDYFPYPSCVKDKLYMKMKDFKKYDNLQEMFVKANQFIHEHISAKISVYVHCFEGKNRGPTIVMGYLLYHVFKTKPFDKVYRFLKTKRRIGILIKNQEQLQEMTKHRVKQPKLVFKNTKTMNKKSNLILHNTTTTNKAPSE